MLQTRCPKRMIFDIVTYAMSYNELWNKLFNI